ncbi:tRNA dimethylallyltransferase, mitochondrial [Vanrija albida]|uniref:tRNA dimethylallyltransferase, mitochondrial n=1 Tax=Vanrija albida TaxID=181172 RepID=A0ABR3Q9K0_9TREE
MQLYKGLDIITNKVTKEEQGGIEHWGLDVVIPGQGGSWELGKWCSEADIKLNSTPLSTLPIICGGTHYFIQHYLFPPEELSFDRPAPKGASRSWSPPGPQPPVPEDLDAELRALLETFWTADPVYPSLESTVETPSATSEDTTEAHHLLSVWRLLQAVDPLEAGRWHWRDSRKVRRGLERWWERGGVELLRQDEDNGTAPDNEEAKAGRRARFRTLIFWVYEPLPTLRPRLDARVDKMVQNGLLQEIEELRKVAAEHYPTMDAGGPTEGIFQSIGYKEFAGLPLPQSDPTSSPLFNSMVDRTKLSTHQYAKSQIKWIRKQLLPAVREARTLGGDVHLFVVPGGEAGEPVARDVLSRFLAQEELPDPATVGHADASSLLQDLSAVEAKIPNTADRQVLNSKQLCEHCSSPGRPYPVPTKEWADHLKSKVHKRNTKFATQSREEWIAEMKAKGQAKKAEKEKLIAEKAKLIASQDPSSSSPNQGDGA